METRDDWAIERRSLALPVRFAFHHSFGFGLVRTHLEKDSLGDFPLFSEEQKKHQHY